MKPPPTTDTLRIDRPGAGVAVLTLDRPEVMNAIDMALFEALDEALAALQDDACARAVVITGAGDRAFSAGFDIHEMAGFDGPAMRAAFDRRDGLFLRVACYRKPVIAALNGVAYGAGALLAAAADIRLGCPTTRFKVTASTYGAANATWTLPRIVGPSKAKEILFTGRAVDAEEAVSIGLLNQLERDRSVLDAAVAMAAMIAANPPEGVEAVKALVDGGFGGGLAAGYHAEHDWMIDHMGQSARPGSDVFGGFLASRGAPAGTDV
jgi:enoyl-CoA hydratase/carnithine racemase